ncbi:MAG: sulfatase-like hydrolase/transferase, partial [Acidobacteriota bacterium]
MNLTTAFRTGARLGAAVALVAGFLEVLGMVGGFVPAYQRGATLGLSAYAVVLYGLVGVVGGAALGGALWLAGVHSKIRPMLLALQGTGWFLAIGAIVLDQSLRYQPVPTAVVVVLNAGLVVAGIGVGTLLWAFERARGRWGLRRLGLIPVVTLALSVAGLLSETWFASLSPSPESTADSSAARPNVILIVMDTTRADHLSAYGYGRQTSPTLDRLAAEGAR